MKKRGKTPVLPQPVLSLNFKSPFVQLSFTGRRPAAPQLIAGLVDLVNHDFFRFNRFTFM